MEKLDFKIKYWIGTKCVQVEDFVLTESAFKRFIVDILLDLPYQLYIYENNYWSWSSLEDYETNTLVLSLKGINSNILIEVFKS